MPYTPPNVFAAGTVLDADELNENFDALDQYLTTGINTASELEADSISSDRILRPRNVVGDRTVSTYFQTGSVHHTRLDALDYRVKDPLANVPYKSAGFISSQYHSASVGYTAYKPVTGTWVTFHVDENPIGVLVRYMGEILVPVDNTGSQETENYILIAYDTTHARESTCRILEESALTFNADRRHVSGCALFSGGLTSGWHHAGLVAGFTSNFGLLGGLELTVEVFY